MARIITLAASLAALLAVPVSAAAADGDRAGANLHDEDRDLAIAVLTDAQPSRLYAIHTVRGIADRLLGSGSR